MGWVRWEELDDGEGEAGQDEQIDVDEELDDDETSAGESQIEIDMRPIDSYFRPLRVDDR